MHSVSEYSAGCKSSPCYNGATCTSMMGDDLFECNCGDEHEGEHCDIERERPRPFNWTILIIIIVVLLILVFVVMVILVSALCGLV